MSTDLTGLVEAARQRRPRAIARLVSMVENGGADLPEAMAMMAGDTGRAHVIGLTGSPGVGKSTMTAALIEALRARDLRVGVLAVDPSSPFSGGAVLGDRVRMQKHALDSDVYIRSMATRGHLGGLSASAPQALRVFDTAGFDVVLVETVGVGQSEVQIAATADTTLVLLAPGMGDGIQAAKAGILEVGDIFVVNKADRDGTQPLIRELRNMVALSAREPGDWKPPIVKTIAAEPDAERNGIAGLLDEVLAHRAHGLADGSWQRRRDARARAEIEALALAAVRRDFTADRSGAGLAALAAAVAAGELDPYRAADRLLSELG